MNLITLKEAAELLNISPRAALNMAKRGALTVRAQTVNGLRANLVSEDDVRALAERYNSEMVEVSGYMRLADAAQKLGISRQLVHEKIRAAGVEPVTKNDRAKYISVEDFKKIAQPAKRGRKPQKPAGL